jgi:hypothetical protein
VHRVVIGKIKKKHLETIQTFAKGDVLTGDVYQTMLDLQTERNKLFNKFQDSIEEEKNKNHG